jgi:ligand-binding sensor domain-containing protein/signal transduction histidine kinase
VKTEATHLSQLQKIRRAAKRSFVRLIVLVALGWLPSQGLALDPSKSVYQYNCRTWTRQNGLPANTVHAATQTKDGYLWLGTSAGLVRFDGGEFRAYDMSHHPNFRSSIITSLAQSQRGGLWFGMERGSFGYFDGKNLSLLGCSAYSGVNLDVRSVMETKDGTLWLATEILAARLTRSNTFDLVLAATNNSTRYEVSALYQDSKERVWLGTALGGLYRWEQGNLTRFPDPIFDDLTIRCLMEDREGALWIGTDRGLLCYDSNSQRKPLAFPWYATRALLMDTKGMLWAGTSGGGLIRFQNGIPVELRQKHGLADDFVTSLAEDDEGSLWVGTRNGLSQISDVKLPTFGKTEGLTADVNVAVAGSCSNGLWVATSEGFSYFDGIAHPFTNQAALANPYITTVFEARNGDLYLMDGSMNLLVVSGGQVVATYPNKVWPTAIAEDNQSVVVSVGGNFFRIGTNYFKPYAFREDQQPPLNWVFSMTTSQDGSIWVAGSAGICRLKEGTWELWTTQHGLADSKAKWVCEDPDGILWAGMEVGLARLKDGKIHNITRDDGLFDNLINTIVPDDYDNLWIDSGRGFFRVSRRSLNDFAEGKTNRVSCEGFDGQEAVKSAQKYQQRNSGCKTPDGRIWFPTAQGIVMIDPTNIVANLVAPKVHLQSVRANGQEVDQFSHAMVRPGHGELEFHYAGVGYLAPLKIRYRYKLEGYDPDWVEAGTRRSAFYTNLKPGTYRFRIQSRYEDGEWNVTAAEATLKLLPFFYQTLWFLVLTIAVLGIVIFGFIAWRMRRWHWNQIQLQRARDQLEASVRERTAELAASNLSLKNEVEERKRMQLEVERIHRQLLETSRQAGMAEVATNVLHNVGNVLNSVNVSGSVVMENLKKSKITNLEKVVTLLREHESDLGNFLVQDARGKLLPSYLAQLSAHLLKEHSGAITELDSLRQNIEHIKEIVNMQQSYARVCGVKEFVNLQELVEDSLRMNLAALDRHGVELVREFETVPPLNLEKHKVLQILVNLVRNAKYACDDSGRPDKRVTIRVTNGATRVQIAVADNGVGIPPENLTRIFGHGFTTRKGGHGFGLHSGALAAKEMGGTLRVHSDGAGTGATFILELPLEPQRNDHAKN